MQDLIKVAVCFKCCIIISPAALCHRRYWYCWWWWWCVCVRVSSGDHIKHGCNSSNNHSYNINSMLTGFFFSIYWIFSLCKMQQRCRKALGLSALLRSRFRFRFLLIHDKISVQMCACAQLENCTPRQVRWLQFTIAFGLNTLQRNLSKCTGSV